MQIVHTEVDVSYASSNKTLEFSEETIKDDSHYEDFKKVEQEGSDGLKQITQRITLKDGMEVSREVVDQVVLEPAVDRIVRVGTKIKYQTNYDGDTRRWKEAPTAGKNGWTKMVVECTAYNTYGRTATGTTTKFGTIAVNPKCIPYGTQMYVPKYGYGVARDTGGFRHEQGGMKNQIDVWIKSESACRRWGRKYNLTILVKLK